MVTRILWVIVLLAAAASITWRVFVRVELSRSIALLEAGHAQQAFDRLERLAGFGVNSAVVDFNAATALLQLGHYDDAAARFRRVASSDAFGQHRGAAWFGTGNADALAGRYREAAAAYRESLRAAPGDDARFNLAWVISRLGDPPHPPPPATVETDALDRLSTPLRVMAPRLPNAPPPVDAR